MLSKMMHIFGINFCRFRVGQIFEFVKPTLFLKTYLGVVYLSLSKQYDPYWYTLDGNAGWDIDLSVAPMDSTSLKIRLTRTIPKFCPKIVLQKWVQSFSFVKKSFLTFKIISALTGSFLPIFEDLVPGTGVSSSNLSIPARSRSRRRWSSSSTCFWIRSANSFTASLFRQDRFNRTTSIRYQCRKTTVLSCHRCLINTGVEKRTTFKYRLEFWSLDVSK